MDKSKIDAIINNVLAEDEAQKVYSHEENQKNQEIEMLKQKQAKVALKKSMIFGIIGIVLIVVPLIFN